MWNVWKKNEESRRIFFSSLSSVKPLMTKKWDFFRKNFWGDDLIFFVKLFFSQLSFFSESALNFLSEHFSELSGIPQLLLNFMRCQEFTIRQLLSTFVKSLNFQEFANSWNFSVPPVINFFRTSATFLNFPEFANSALRSWSDNLRSCAENAPDTPPKSTSRIAPECHFFDIPSSEQVPGHFRHYPAVSARLSEL